MGVERAVTRWYVQRQMISYEIEVLKERLQRLSAQQQKQEAQGEEAQAIQQQLVATERKLRELGNCPRPMMG